MDAILVDEGIQKCQIKGQVFLALEFKIPKIWLMFNTEDWKFCLNLFIKNNFFNNFPLLTTRDVKIDFNNGIISLPTFVLRDNNIKPYFSLEMFILQNYDIVTPGAPKPEFDVKYSLFI